MNLNQTQLISIDAKQIASDVESFYFCVPFAKVAQLARASPCHGEGRGFESRLSLT